jgi:L-amino acid N-acyltransferase
MMIRQARPDDARAICDIWNTIIDDTLITFTSENKIPSAIAADIETRGPGFQVAEREGEVIGFATYFPFRGGPGYAFTKEHSIQFSPKARGMGMGRALMQRLERAAMDEQVHSLWAGISSENPAGIAFHGRIGFKEIARLPEVGRKNDQWLDLILMRKILSSKSTADTTA